MNSSQKSVLFELSNASLLKNEHIKLVDDFEIFKEFIELFNPKTIEDLAICISVSRKDLDDIRENIIEVKNQNKKCKDPILAPFVSETYGEIIYREQIMNIVMELANFTLEDATLYFKACAKKLRYKLEIYVPILQNVCLDKGIDLIKSKEIVDIMYEIAPYTFRKSYAIEVATKMYETELFKNK